MNFPVSEKSPPDAAEEDMRYVYCEAPQVRGTQTSIGLPRALSRQPVFDTTMEPRFNEVPRDWGNCFVISKTLI